MSRISLGYCEAFFAAATGNGSVSMYLDTFHPAPARLARENRLSLRHFH